MIRVALYGFGHLGKIHYKCLTDTQFELVGICDPKLDEKEIEGVPVVNDIASLMDRADAVIIASTTASHYEIAKLAMEKNKHIFLEKPMTSTLEKARELVENSRIHPRTITQVGFVERFNPAFEYLKDKITEPRFIEVHRLANFNPRGNDVSVVFDLMIHDLDILGLIMKSPIKSIRAHGVRIISDHLDICNARLEYMDGSVANLTASRMSLKQMRKFRIFQPTGYMSMDLDKKESQIVEISANETADAMPIESGENKKYLKFRSSGILEGNAILSELNEFYNSIKTQTSGEANFENAYQTSLVADQIENIAKASSHI